MDRMPGHRIVVEMDRYGEPVRIIRRHSTSRHGHHQHRNWLDERADITNGELDSMRERERQLAEANDAFSRENHNLKASLAQAERTIRHHDGVEAQLRSNIQSLAVENGDLRRSLEAYRRIAENHQATTAELRRNITRLEKENTSLAAQVEQLGKDLKNAVNDRVRALTEEITKWRRKWEALDHQYERIRASCNAYIHENEDLKERNAILLRRNDTYLTILKRHHLI